VTSRRSPLGSRSPEAPQSGSQFLSQTGRGDITTAGEGTDHHVLGMVQAGHHIAGDVAQPPGQPMPLHGRSDRSRDNQSEFGIAGGMPHIDDQIRLHGSLSTLDRRVEIGRPRHAVTRGKHRRHTGFEESGSQRTSALATPIRHNRPAGPGPHPQPETVHAGTAPVIRLEGPLALCHDSLLAASGIVPDPVSRAGGLRSPPRRLDRLCVSL
jgi:hypothetical protein